MKVRFSRAWAYALLGAGVTLGTAAPIWASVATAPPVPEIGPGSIAAGLGLLAAGVLAIRARRSK